MNDSPMLDKSPVLGLTREDVEEYLERTWNDELPYQFVHYFSQELEEASLHILTDERSPFRAYDLVFLFCEVNFQLGFSLEDLVADFLEEGSPLWEYDNPNEKIEAVARKFEAAAQRLREAKTRG